MTEEQKDINRAELIDEMEARIDSGKYNHLQGKAVGIRSRQVAALIDILVDNGFQVKKE